MRIRRLIPAIILYAVAAGAAPAPAQESAASASQVDPSLYSAMRWRLIGPHRAGRVTAVAGIPGDPTTYYMGTPGGGVWKTTDAGDVWTPIFDAARVASIGALAVAPSNSNIIYVATGEQTRGNGMYKSTDAGATWTHIGLEDTEYISSVIVDPRNPDIVVVGALGHLILGASAEKAARGVYKSSDGGKTWTRTLFRDEKAGVCDLVADPNNPRVLYAALWHPRDFFTPPTGTPEQDNWIYKSVDEGSTWKQVPGTGLPAEPLDRVGLAVAPGDRGRRVFAISGQGLFRSDDAGDTWRKITTDPRITGYGYICHVYVDPRNPDLVYVMQTTTYRSTDAGKTFAAFKGAPGGDDYHVMWIDPQNPQRMILGVDQGATVSVDGGKTWSLWFNQPTGQFYHVVTDNQFPYLAYAPQQDSGTAAVPSRSDYGEISFRDWFSIGGFEFCFIAPDPLNPNIVYSGGWYGSVVRFDKTTGQIAHVFVRSAKYRTGQMPPLVFSPQDPRTLYFGTQYVMKTANGGESWQTISPDLTVRPQPPAGDKPQGAELLPRKDTPLRDKEAGAGGQGTALAVPKDVAYSGALAPEADLPGNRLDPRSFAYEMDDDKDFDAAQTGRRPAALSAIAPSTLASGLLWAGADDGVIQRTEDGGLTWQDVSPPGLTATSFVSNIEASHHDPNTAYASIDVLRDPTPWIYRTRDGGKTWQKITAGLEPGWIVRVVRDDPERRGLLYAGTENAVYVSFDDGDHWQSLQLNLPAATVRDLVVHGNDIVVATYGRALWLLDDISPLRQAGTQVSGAAAALLRPALAVRTRWDNDQETPLPPEVPAAPNPPDGALLYYYLKSAPDKPVTLEIHDSDGRLARRFSSEPPPADATLKNVPDYWFAPLPQLTGNAGLNRFVWDLHYDAPPALQYSYYGNALDYIEYTLTINAIKGQTPREQALGPLAVPGQYEVTLTVGDQKLTQALTVALDPRVRASQADLVQQFRASRAVSAGLRSSYDAYNAITAFRAALSDRQKTLAASLKENAQAKEAADAAKELDSRIDAIQAGTRGAPGIGPINRDLGRIAFMIETGDAAPSESAQAAVHESCSALSAHLTAWRQLHAQAVPALNALLDKYKLAPLPSVAAAPSGSAGSAGVSGAHAPLPPPPAGDSAESAAPPADACSP